MSVVTGPHQLSELTCRLAVQQLASFRERVDARGNPELAAALDRAITELEPLAVRPPELPQVVDEAQQLGLGHDPHVVFVTRFR